MAARQSGQAGRLTAMTASMQRRQKTWRQRVMTGTAMSERQTGHSSCMPSRSTATSCAATSGVSAGGAAGAGAAAAKAGSPATSDGSEQIWRRRSRISRTAV
jgi:hypothetical protein